MAKNVTIANVDYSNVPSIEVPLTAGGGNAKFVEISATTATADKILTGYGAYSSSGVWMDGTATQGGGSGAVIQDQDGYIVLDDDAPIPSGANFQWATQTFIETIEANSITNTSEAKAYFDNKYNYKFAILLSPLTVNNQVVYIFYNSVTSGAAARWRNGGIAGTNIATNYDGRLVEGSKYIILSMDAPVNNMALPEYTEQELAEVGRIMMGYAIDN